jgi:GT2 family glycosyltransferase
MYSPNNNGHSIMNRVELSAISIVVLSYNRLAVLRNNLKTLLHLVELYGCELIVVDNASSDGSIDMISEALSAHQNAWFISNGVNLGVAGGRNVGWREAKRDFILSIDDDTLITAEAVQIMRSAMYRHPELGIVSPRILHAVSSAPQLAFAEPGCQLANFHGACHLVRRAVIDAVGFNDEGCTFGGEELDLSIRARAAGFDVRYVGAATVLHDNITRKGEVGRDRRERWVYNFTRVFYKHFPLHAAVPFSSRYFLSHLVSGLRAYGPSFILPLVKAAARGFRDGRRQHRVVPAEVVQFYRNPDLRPAFGNMPLWRKTFARTAWK